MRGMLARMLAIERRACLAALVVAGVLLVSLVLLSGGNVALRLAGRPSGGSYELSGFAGALVAALALAEAQRRQGLVQVDIFTRRMSPRVLTVLAVLNACIGMGLITILAIQLMQRARVLLAAGELSETLKIPYPIFMLAMAAGLGLLALIFACDLVLTLTGRKRPQGSPS